MILNRDSAPPARVLIVDDERQNRELLEAMLAPDGFVLLLAASGEEALAIVIEQSPDLILLDMMMPGMSGHQVAAVMKSNPATKNIPIIMVSALTDRETKLLGLTAGAEDFLSKPIDRAELWVKVRNLLRLKAYADYHDRYGQMLEDEVGLRTADLVASERLYRSTFDEAPVGIVHVSMNGRWLRVNQHLCDLLGYSRVELQSAASQELLQASETKDEAEMLRSLANGKLDRHIVEDQHYRCKDGRSLSTRTKTSVQRDTNGQAQHFITVIEDMTERRALEAQVRHSGKMDAIGQLASGIAHDFNNLLSVILTYSQLLATDLKEGDPARADLDEITSAGLRAAELTRQLLAFSRKQVLQPKIVDLAAIVSGMEKMLQRLIGEDVELTTTAAAALGKILVDPGQMEQVIMNLAVNARDAMPRGGSISIEASEVQLDSADASALGCVSTGRHVVLAFRDTGTGMDKATQMRMFEPFFTTKEAGKGTGLGLATVFGIIRQSGGAIGVESEPGKGTTFKIYFPVVEKNLAPMAASPFVDRRTLRGSETILLVEDEERVRGAARTILRKHGYTVLEAQSAGDAFLLCEQHGEAIDLLLTDVVMPRMSGRQLAERLLPLRPHMKVLYMSGYMDDAVVRHGILDSSIAFIQKPITPETLARKVREILGAVTIA